MNSIDLRDGIMPPGLFQPENGSHNTGFIDTSVPSSLEFESPIKVVGKTTNLTPVENSDQINILTGEQRDVASRIATASVRTVFDWENRQIQFLPDHTVVMDRSIIANVVAESMGITQGDVVYQDPVVPAQNVLNQAVAARDRFRGRHDSGHLTVKQGWRAQRLEKAVNDAEAALSAAQARAERITSGAPPWWDKDRGLNDFGKEPDHRVRAQYPAPQMGEQRAEPDHYKPTESGTTVALTNSGVVGGLLGLLAKDNNVSWKKKFFLLSFAGSIVLDSCAPLAPNTTVPFPTPRPESSPGLVNKTFVFDSDKHFQFVQLNIDDGSCKKPDQFFIDIATKSQGALGQFNQLAEIALAALKKSGNGADIGSIQCEISNDGKSILVYFMSKDGKKILIPTNDGLLFPGEITATGSLRPIDQPSVPPSNVGSTVFRAPESILPSGGGVPDLIQADVARERVSLRESMRKSGFNPDDFDINFFQNANGGPYQWGDVMVSKDGLSFLVALLTNGQLAGRPDFRGTQGGVKFDKWIRMQMPKGVTGNIVAAFVQGEDLPRVLVVDKNPGADGKMKVLAVLNPVKSEWTKADGSALVPPATSTPEVRNWVKQPPINFAECCALNSEYANKIAKEKFDAINTPSFKEKVNRWKTDPRYIKPSFVIQPVLDPLGIDIAYQYTAYTQTAIYAGGYDVTLPKMDWSIGKDIEIKVKMHIYIPIDKPDSYVVTIGRGSYIIGKTEDVFGTRFFHKETTLPNGQIGFAAQVGQEPTPGQVFYIYSATGMGVVDVHEASKSSSQYNPSFAAQGKSLMDNLGMVGANDVAKQVIALSDKEKRIALMQTFFDSQKFHLLIRALLLE